MDWQGIEIDSDLERLVGKTIVAAEWNEAHHLCLTLSDGMRAEVCGVGYDGLWDDVIVALHPEVNAEPDANQEVG